ncbi:hypothetical protein B1222_11440 [Paenibacillus larvae subsp. pulvifaciens]|nr:hypothetical protein B1222_11440 [Paenibacillus larvae subsp. pulvifaciens]AQZ46852.1 hypothetical protein B5S25_09880 [Paenibacillus larvae subsp. pulvifaciens]MBH0341674.1 hypothetical protein [Paenibacillus larvae]
MILLSKFITKRPVLVTQIYTEVPFLIPYINILFVPMLVIWVLFLMAQLAVFDIFIHGADMFILNMERAYSVCDYSRRMVCPDCLGSRENSAVPVDFVFCRRFLHGTIFIIQFFLGQQKKAYSLPSFLNERSFQIKSK